MGFWWFMLIQLLLIPVIMIFSGRLMWKHYPKEINAIWGYRTTRSTQNEETWKFANQYCGRLYEKIGWATLILPILIMLPFCASTDNIIGCVGTVVCVLQVIGIIVPIFPTERALKKNFPSEK